MALLAEAYSLRLRVGTLTSSVSFVPYLASLLLFGPAWSMAIAGSSELTAEILLRRKPAIKVLHNTGKEVVAIGVAAYLYLYLGGSFTITSFLVAFPAFVASVVVYFLVTNGAVAAAMTLSSGSGFADNWRATVGKTLTYDVLSASLSLLVAFVYVELQVIGLLLVVIPLFFLRHAHSMNLDLEEVNRELLLLMVKAIEARDPYTSGHSQRVAELARALAREIGFSVRQAEEVSTAALLHDVGKIHEEYAPLLRKQGKLTAEEKLLMRSHPTRSADLVATISNLRGPVENYIRHHHEHYDGAGYPDGVAGEDIPLGARIIMIADTTDAMTTDRPYRNALTYSRVVEELEKYAGRQFDPALVAAFKRSGVIRQLVASWQQQKGSAIAADREKAEQLAAR